MSSCLALRGDRPVESILPKKISAAKWQQRQGRWKGARGVGATGLVKTEVRVCSDGASLIL